MCKRKSLPENLYVIVQPNNRSIGLFRTEIYWKVVARKVHGTRFYGDDFLNWPFLQRGKVARIGYRPKR